jgi:hypothetical protein
MNIGKLLDFLNESISEGFATDSSPVIALCRNTKVSLDSEKAWIESPIVDVELDGDEVDLIMTSLKERKGMSVSELTDKLNSLSVKYRECSLFVCGDYEPIEGQEGWTYRQDMPVITAVRNPELNIIGVMPWYDGYEKELATEGI